MKKRRSILAALAAASVALAGVHLGPSPVTAAGNVFDAGTVAHRYNFTFSGRGGDGNTIAMVGWFEVDAQGQVVGGAAHGSSSLVGLPVSRRATLSSTADNRMAVSDPANGIYDLTLLFVGPVVAPTQLTLSVILDDPRGRSGKVAGEYRYQSTEIGGVGVGEIAIQ